MILSASRRTDIPNYYPEWFMNRIREGYVYVRNPFNYHQVSKISLSPQVIDCMVLWSKNPVSMLKYLDQLKDYTYYVQYTLTGYGKDIEGNLPDKKNNLIPAFLQLSGTIGSGRVVWRYDPILLSDRYTMEYHKKAFHEIAGALKGYTNRVYISFTDFYEKTRRNTKGLHIRDMTEEEMISLSASLAEIACDNHMEIVSCAEIIDLESVGIGHGSCIDKSLIETLTGCSLEDKKDSTRRKKCGCMASIDIGTYNTCQNGCRYCYANASPQRVENQVAKYDPASPFLCSALEPEDKIIVRKTEAWAIPQLKLPLDF